MLDYNFLGIYHQIFQDTKREIMYLVLLQECACKECSPLGWHNDGYCDDILNNENCAWDGKDCCGENVVTTYCSDCLCLDPSAPCGK